MKVLFVAGFGPIVPDDRIGIVSELYAGTLGIQFERDGDYFHTGNLEGVKHFAVWPLSQAAESCFGTSVWPTETPIPQAWWEFDVDDVSQATQELEQRGYQCVVRNRTEPWGQTVTRLLSPEGILLGLTHTPWFRNE